MRARVVPAPSGARWLAEGWRILRASPLAWPGIVFAYLLMTQIVAFVPLVGIAVALGLVPVFTTGLMGAARAASLGAAPNLAMLFDGFRQELRPQLVLGAVYLLLTFAAFGGAMYADGTGALRQVFLEGAGERVSDADLVAAVVPLALLYLPVLLLFWFAPQLAGWHSTGAAKALFFSLFACLLNWRAFLVYAVVTAVFAFALPVFALQLLVVITGWKILPGLALVPVALVVLPTLYGSYYASYRDVFVPAAGETQPQAAP
jgi:hypothetical protein